MLDFLTGLSPRFKLLKNPIARRTVGSVATISQVASIGGMGADEFMTKVAGEIERRTGERVAVSSGGTADEDITDPAARHEVLKEIIRDLHAGADVASVKDRFRRLIKNVDAGEISKMEQKLIEEGLAQEEVQRLCDVHVEIFKESLEAKEPPAMPAGHPVDTFMRENRASEEIMGRLASALEALGDPPDLAGHEAELQELVDELRKIDLHYVRKENQLFPLMENHDIAGPSQVMWGLHDEIRGMLKGAGERLGRGDAAGFARTAREAIRTIRDMIYKEEHILYPLAVDTLTEREWGAVRNGEEEIGYAWIEPAAQWRPAGGPAEPVAESPAEGHLDLDTGRLTVEQVNLLLKLLPVDISFVDENDTVAYYSATPDRVFPRSPGVIGRLVQKCHPPKSLHVVQRILDDFRAGKRDTAEFWIQMEGKFIHIRYFAVRDRAGEYRGCLEVSQDVTGIRELEGERRLLDW